MIWTAREDALLRELYATRTRQQIADRLGRTEGMVRSRCWTLGLASKITQWTDAEVQELRVAYTGAVVSEQLNLDALAQRFGRHKSNVCRKARALGLTDHKRREVLNRKKPAPRKFETAAERNAAIGASMKLMIAERGHSRGALGMKHTEQAKERMAQATKRAWADPNSRFNSEEMRQYYSDRMVKRIAEGGMRSGYSRTRGGKRADLGDCYFRSAWEANYARYLNFLKARGEIAKWQYECKTFVFEPIKRGTRAYTPDFKVTLPSGSYEWHEVKGWMDAASETRLKRMAKYYPDEKIVVVGAGWFRATNKSALPGIIAHWEFGTTR